MRRHIKKEQSGAAIRAVDRGVIATEAQKRAWRVVIPNNWINRQHSTFLQCIMGAQIQELALFTVRNAWCRCLSAEISRLLPVKVFLKLETGFSK